MDPPEGKPKSQIMRPDRCNCCTYLIPPTPSWRQRFTSLAAGSIPRNVATVSESCRSV